MRIVGGSLVHRLRVVVRIVVDRGHTVVNGLHCSVYKKMLRGQILSPRYDNPTPYLTISPSPGLGIWPQAIPKDRPKERRNRYTRVLIWPVTIDIEYPLS